MISAEQLSGLLGDLYAAPLEPEKWQEFFDELCALTECRSGHFIQSHAGNHQVLAFGGLDLDPEAMMQYNAHYAAQDPLYKPCFTQRRIGVIPDEEYIGRAELVKTEYYNDLLIPFHLERTIVMPCTFGEDSADIISLSRSSQQDHLGLDGRRLLELLLPHVKVALRLRAQMLALETARVFSETALDAMSIAAFLARGDGSVVHMNGRAESCVKKDKGIALRGGRLVADTLTETAQMERLLRAATSDFATAPGGAMRVEQPASGNYLQVTVVPAPEENQIAGRERYALVLVSDPAEKAASRANVMRQLYGLTPTECRLADALLECLEVREAAERLRITLETARFHVKRILSKTGARRQAELMRLMMMLPGCEAKAASLRE